MMERFTKRATLSMALANQEAQRMSDPFIGTEHMLLGLLKEGSGLGVTVLKSMDVDLESVRLEVEKTVKSVSGVSPGAQGHPAPRAKKVIEYAIEEARKNQREMVGTDHLLLGLIRESEGIAGQVLKRLAPAEDRIREEINKFPAET